MTNIPGLYIARADGYWWAGTTKGVSWENSTPPPPRPTGPTYVRYEDTYVAGDDLQAVINRVTGNRVLTFPEGTFLIPNNFPNGLTDGVRMGAGSWGAGCRGFAGSGPNTIFTMLSDNHTKQTLGTGLANNFILIDAYGPEVIPATMAFEFRNFTLQGSTLGANGDLDYNGLRLAYAKDSIVENVLVTGIGGSDNIPPGETGGIASYYCDGLSISSSEIDGRRASVRESATGLLMNRSTHTTVTDFYGHDNMTGSAGGAWWHCDHVTVTSSRVDRMGTAGHVVGCWNHEESDHISYTNCVTLHGTDLQGPHYSLNSVGPQGPPEVPANPSMLISNPTWDGAQASNGQLRVDTWAGDQHASVPPTILDGNGLPIPFFWSNPFGVTYWQNQ